MKIAYLDAGNRLLIIVTLALGLVFAGCDPAGNTGPECGDNYCDPIESCDGCPTDCDDCLPVCGDHTCEGDEDCDACPEDCGLCPAVCGDSVCEGAEDAATCPVDCDDWPADWADKEVVLLDLINDFRGQAQTCGGLSMPAVAPLVLDPFLRLAARLHAQDMVDNDYASHTSLDGREWEDRIFDAGYPGSCPCTELLGSGLEDPQGVMNLYAAEEYFCLVLMDSAYTSIGLGYAHHADSSQPHTWVQNFAN